MNYTLKPNLLLQAVAGETVILDPDSGSYFTLDEVGSRMLERYRETGSLEGSVALLLEEYDTDAETLREDLEALLRAMEGQGLVERTAGEP